MAEAMQGIMSLPPEMGGMENAPRTFLTPEDDATLNRLRESVSPQEFSQQMFDAAEQVDPQMVMQLRSMLRGMQLPPELITAMQQMVEALLDEPQNYEENRREFIKEGVPEDLLPEQFDPMYLTALNMALDQLSGPMVQGFAAGGLVRNPIAQGIASLGRNGDTMLAHITPGEARMLRRWGGSGTINPATGLPEFFLKAIAKAVGGAFKAVGKAVTGAVKGVANAVKSFAKSSIGRIVTSVALGFFLGPAAASMLGVTSAAGVAAISGFVGGAGSTLLAGGSIKDALKTGALGGLTAGAISGVTGGAAAFQSGSYTGPTTISGQAEKLTEQWNKLTGGAKPTLGATGETLDEVAAAKGAPTTAGPSGATSAQSVPNYKINPATGKLEFDGTFTNYQTDRLGQTIGTQTTGTPRFGPAAPLEAAAQNLDELKLDAISGRTQAVPSPVLEQTGVPAPATNLSSYTGTGARVQPSLSGTSAPPTSPAPSLARTDLSGYTGTGARVQPSLSGTGLVDDSGFRMLSSAEARSVYAHPNYNPALSANAQYDKLFPSGAPTQPMLGEGLKIPGTSTTPRLDAMNITGGTDAASQPGVMELLKNQEYKQALGRAYDYISPTSIQEAGRLNAQDVYAKTLAQTGSKELAMKAYESAMPGLLATYGPMAAAGTGAAYMLGAFDVQQPPTPQLPPSGSELFDRNPYLLNPMINTIYASTGKPYQFVSGGATLGAVEGMPSTASGNFSEFLPPTPIPLPGPRTYLRKGGIASLDRRNYPRRTGEISGPGTGTSDDVPAMLSDGEFVFTAKAVRAMGNGSRRKGAKRMYALMKALENKG